MVTLAVGDRVVVLPGASRRYVGRQGRVVRVRQYGVLVAFATEHGHERVGFAPGTVRPIGTGE